MCCARSAPDTPGRCSSPAAGSAPRRPPASASCTGWCERGSGRSGGRSRRRPAGLQPGGDRRVQAAPARCDGRACPARPTGAAGRCGPPPRPRRGSLPSSRKRNRDGSPIDRLLIANRGEIAVRVTRACRELGIEVARACICPDERRRAARAAGRRGRHRSRRFLDADAILAAAVAMEADAIHPGYGYLAENSDFAERGRCRGHHLDRTTGGGDACGRRQTGRPPACRGGGSPGRSGLRRRSTCATRR